MWNFGLSQKAVCAILNGEPGRRNTVQTFRREVYGGVWTRTDFSGTPNRELREVKDMVLESIGGSRSASYRRGI